MKYFIALIVSGSTSSAVDVDPFTKEKQQAVPKGCGHQRASLGAGPGVFGWQTTAPLDPHVTHCNPL